MTAPAPLRPADPDAAVPDVPLEERFGFGANWTRFLRLLTPQRIAQAEESLCTLLGVARLDGKRFLDIGSGSGLFSLAARRLGASVVSFDFDPQSVACARELRRRYVPEDTGWRIERGSALDGGFVASLGTFDVVYSWGVLHHTGAMWHAVQNATRAVAPGGVLCIALYNDQGRASRYWTHVKRAYISGAPGRIAMTALHAPYLIGARFAARALTGRLALERGMSLWYDMHDWLGGFPFEVATPAEVDDRLRTLGFVGSCVRDCGRRHGCNEFVYRRA
jgi:2-polyprenyl-6-hydroxyphenyl methylase/3-demethylubiquinone-9 3-methyltransferase